MVIRNAKPNDFNQIRSLLIAAFNGPAEADLMEELRRANKVSLELVAEEDSIIWGHVCFSPVIIQGIQGRELIGVGLAPVGVAPKMQRKGIGKDLIYRSIDILQKRKVPFSVVLGDPAYYSQFGFRSATPYGVKCEFEGLEGAFQLMALANGEIPNGLAKYCSAFDIFKS